MTKSNKGKLIACILVTAIFVSSVALYPTSSFRTTESLWELLTSLAYYFLQLLKSFGVVESNITPTVLDFSKHINISTFLPADWEGFKFFLQDFYKLLFSGENFVIYLYSLVQQLKVVLLILTLLLPLLVILLFAGKKLLLSPSDNEDNTDSKALASFKKIEYKVYRPVKAKFQAFWQYAKANYFALSWIVLTLMQLNVLSVVMTIVAYLLYFAVSIDVASLYILLCKVVMDLSFMYTMLPLFAWIVIALVILNKWRHKVGLDRLRSLEARNQRYIGKLPYVLLITGTMGSKKTTTLTDMLLSLESMFRCKALELMQENDSKFPKFPWIKLERELTRAVYFGGVYNLASTRAWVGQKEQRFCKNPTKGRIFDYDFAQEAIAYNSPLGEQSIWQVIESYSQEYFIYLSQTSLIVSNYSVRTDNVQLYEGHFPLWNCDFFVDKQEHTRYSHILDYDMLRLGKKLSSNSHLFEFGLIGASELGKERGNMLELQGVKKQAEETNPKNDLFNNSLNFLRHKATVDNYCFARFLADEQRASRWGADGKELATLLSITDSSSEQLTMPLYFIEELLHDMLYPRYLKLYTEYRFNRSDNTLPMYLIRNLATKLHKHHKTVTDTFGYYINTVKAQSGTLEEPAMVSKYYLCKKKIYAKRFSTDCFSEILTANQAKSGLAHLPEYDKLKASLAELEAQNSYLVRDIKQMVDQCNAQSPK